MDARKAVDVFHMRIRRRISPYAPDVSSTFEKFCTVVCAS